jgi:hypothetical protein
MWRDVQRRRTNVWRTVIIQANVGRRRSWMAWKSRRWWEEALQIQCRCNGQPQDSRWAAHCPCLMYIPVRARKAYVTTQGRNTKMAETTWAIPDWKNYLDICRTFQGSEEYVRRLPPFLSWSSHVDLSRKWCHHRSTFHLYLSIHLFKMKGVHDSLQSEHKKMK